MHAFRRAASLTLALCLSLSLPSSLFGATGDTVPQKGDSTILIEQKNVDDIIGSWTLLQPGQIQEGSKDSQYTFYERPAGNYSLFVSPPEGTTAAIRVYKGGILTQTVERPQLNFTLGQSEQYRLVVVYSFTRVGTVVVSSDPPGLEFTMTGPNQMLVTGVTPASYESAAEGQYSVRFKSMEGCYVPAPKALLLEAEKRISFLMTLHCDAADALREKLKKTGEEYVTTKVGGKDIVFLDVPQNAWFASVVFNAAKWGILSGYRDVQGKLTGEFGPANPVTIAELSKIAHEVAGIDEEEFSHVEAENTLALGRWFTAYFTSAEQRGWTIFADAQIDPGREATRGEVVVTLLQALNIPLRWQKGTVFGDVTTRTTFASAIETAAEDGLVSGTNDELDRPTGLFAPTSPVNRAEMAKIINSAIKVYRTGGSASSARSASSSVKQ